MHEQRMQLVQRDPCPPAVRERGRPRVGADDVLQMRRAEQRQHGQVGLPVTAVGGRVDEPAAARRPQHVAGPAVAVDAARRLPRAGQLADPPGDRFHQPDIGRPQRPGVGRAAQVRQHPALGVPPGPAIRRRPRGVVQRQAGDEPGPRCAEAVRAGGVHPREFMAERAGRAGRGRPGGIQESTRARSSQPRTSGTGTATAPASQRRPRASASKAARVPVSATLANAWRPSARVTR